MDRNEAEQIAELINGQNRLSVRYSADQILADAEHYIVERDGSVVVGCVNDVAIWQKVAA